VAGSAPGAEDGPPPLYRWKDRQGVIRYTPTKAHIPASERDAAIRVEPTRATPPLPERAEPIADGGARPEPPAPPDRFERPAPVPVGSGSDDDEEDAGYAIQLGATPLSEGVPPLPLIGLPSGLRVYQTRAERSGDAWTRTRVGPFATRTEARAMLELLGSRFPGAWIVAVPPSAADTDVALPGPPVAAGPPAAPAPPYLYVIQLLASVKTATPAPLPRVDLPEGLRLFRTSFEKNGLVWERTRVGFFPTREAAEALRTRLEARFPGAWIARVPAAERVAAAPATGTGRP
jgi:cell division septation protein DedD